MNCKDSDYTGYAKGTEYNCDRCGEYTPDGHGMYLDKTIDGEGTDDRVCGECYDEHAEVMGDR